MASGVTDRADIVVAGAGVVGLAIARALAATGREVVILEKASAFGTATSSRNSEVIHAGLYYPTGSLKARLCVEGRDKLYRYCASRGVGHRKCGKLIVAVDRAQPTSNACPIPARGIWNRRSRPPAGSIPPRPASSIATA